MPDIKISQTVAVLVDGNNVERSIHGESNDEATMLNFETFIPKILKDRALNRLIYFREGKNISSRLAERLHDLYYGSVRACHKSADIPLSICATQLAGKVDTIVIMSGDSDYVELVAHLKSEGVRVEIASVKSTTAQVLLEAADFYHPITREDWFIFNSPRSGSAPGANPGGGGQARPQSGHASRAPGNGGARAPSNASGDRSRAPGNASSERPRAAAQTGSRVAAGNPPSRTPEAELTENSGNRRTNRSSKRRS